MNYQLVFPYYGEMLYSGIQKLIKFFEDCTQMQSPIEIAVQGRSTMASPIEEVIQGWTNLLPPLNDASQHDFPNNWCPPVAPYTPPHGSIKPRITQRGSNLQRLYHQRPIKRPGSVEIKKVRRYRRTGEIKSVTYQTIPYMKPLRNR